MLTGIDRSVVGVILGRRAVTPRRKPVTRIEEIVTASDQLHTGVTLMIPALIVPFRMIRAEHLVMLALPAIASLNPMILVESNCLDLLRLWLCLEARVLRSDLLHLLRIRLLRPGSGITLHVLLVGCRSRRSCVGSSCGLLHTLTWFVLLLFADFRR